MTVPPEKSTPRGSPPRATTVATQAAMTTDERMMACHRHLMKLKFGLVRKRIAGGLPAQMLNCEAPAGRLDRMASNIVRDTKTAVNTFAINPKKSVVANPRIGPV